MAAMQKCIRPSVVVEKAPHHQIACHHQIRALGNQAEHMQLTGNAQLPCGVEQNTSMSEISDGWLVASKRAQAPHNHRAPLRRGQTVQNTEHKQVTGTTELPRWVAQRLHRNCTANRVCSMRFKGCTRIHPQQEQTTCWHGFP